MAHATFGPLRCMKEGGKKEERRKEEGRRKEGRKEENKTETRQRRQRSLRGRCSGQRKKRGRTGPQHGACVAQKRAVDDMPPPG